MTLPQRPLPPTASTTQIPIHPQALIHQQPPLGPRPGPYQQPAYGRAAGETYGAIAPQPWLTIGGHSFGRPGPVAVAAIVAGVLVLFGVGAIVIPQLTSGATATTNRAGTGPAGAVAPPVTVATSDPANADVISDTPTPAATTTTAHPTQSAVTGNAKFEEQVVSLVNDERRKAHCQPVRMDDKLRTAARAHSVDMAVNNFVDHTGSDGSSPSDRMRTAGYTQGLSENIDRGHNSPQDVMKAWMHNGDDRGNILNCAARAIGVGTAFRGKTPYWTQNFGRA